MTKANYPRKFSYRAFVFCFFLSTLIVFSCKQGTSRGKKDVPVIPDVELETVTITVKGGAGVSIVQNGIFTVDKNSSWVTVKQIVEKHVFFEKGFESGGWKLHGAGGGYLDNLYIFTEDRTVFAVSKPKGSSTPEKVIVSVDGDNGIDILNLTPVTVDKGSAWKDVKFSVQDKIVSRTGFAIRCWTLEDASGELLDDNYVFNENVYVFAVSELKKYTVTFTQPEDGALTATLANVNFVSGSQVEHGSIITFTAKPAFNYKVKKWHGIKGENNAKNVVNCRILATTEIYVEMDKNTDKLEITRLDLPGTGTFDTDFDYKYGKAVNIKIKGKAFNTSSFNIDNLDIKVMDSNGKECGSIESKNLEDCETVDIVYRFPSSSQVSDLENLKVIAELNGKKMEEQFLPAYIENSTLKKWKADSSVEKVKLPEYITKIGEEAFSKCNNLTNIDLGNTLEIIGVAAFEECISLQQITIPESVSVIEVNDEGWGGAFLNCKSLEDIKIKNKVVGAAMFLGCTALQKLTIPENVTEIGKAAFLGCIALEELIVPATVKDIGAQAFAKCWGLKKVDIQGSIIGASMFEECSALESITIPSHVTRLETDRAGRSAAFKSCNSLKHIKLENSILGSAMFQECLGLESITIPANITEFQLNDTKWNSAFIGCEGLKNIKIETSIVPSGIFASCYGLEKLHIPANVREIHRAAFGDCERLMFLTVDENNPVYCSENNVVYTKDKTMLVFAPASITVINIPDTVKKINEAAFFGCMDLRVLNIGDNVTSIGEGAFLNCDHLTSVTIGKGCEKIDDLAFSNCFRVKDMVIKSEVLNHIGRYAFKRLDSITQFKVKTEEVKNLILNSISGIKPHQITVDKDL